MIDECCKIKIYLIEECCSVNEKLKVGRTLGFEIEGFVYDSDNLSVSYADVGWDGSVNGGNGDTVEVRTEPISDLNKLQDVYSDLLHDDFNVNDTCGLHIHVGVEDYTIKDKAKLLRFGAGIELLMYALVEPYRYYGSVEDEDEGETHNQYCVKLHHSWRKLFRQNFIEQPIPFNTFDSLDELCTYINEHSDNTNRAWNGKYQWLNANVEYYPTVEFRIFSATEDYEQAQKFGMLAYHIVETVKNSTVKQISFIIKSIYESTSLDEMYSKLFDSIGLDQEFHLPVLNTQLADYIFNKYCQQSEEQAV